MKKLIFSLLLAILFPSCTTNKIKKDDHSYTYIYQHNENPDTIQMNNKLKKESGDNLEIPTKGNVKNYIQQTPANESDENQFAARSSFTPETQEYLRNNSRQSNQKESAYYYVPYPKNRY
jgi:hypothetical protein